MMSRLYILLGCALAFNATAQVVMVDPEKLAAEDAKWDKIEAEVEDIEAENAILKEHDKQIPELDKKLLEQEKALKQLRSLYDLLSEDAFVMWLPVNTNLPPLTARFQQEADGKLQFLRRNGMEVKVPSDMFMPEDRAYINRLKEEGGLP